MAAKVRLDAAIERYSRAQQFGGEQQLVASGELHNAVIGFWWRMREHVRGEDGWEDVSEIDAVTGESIYQGHHPKTLQSVNINGLADLRDWVEKHHIIKAEVDSPLSSTTSERKRVPVQLPGEAAIRAAQVLIAKFVEKGWDATPQRDTEIDEPSPEDLEGLRRARGQDEAASQLPARFRPDDDGDSATAATDGGEKP